MSLRMSAWFKRHSLVGALVLGGLIIAFAPGFWGCDDNGDGNGNGQRPELDLQELIDSVTSATPGLETAILTESHDGWANPACDTCHVSPYPHLDGFDVPQCVTCHGTNGASNRTTANHPTDADCSTCHAGSHAAMNFVSPSDCRACHRYDTTEYEASGTCTHEETYDVVVIGSGGGGLAAAAVLTRLGGKNVLVLEQHHKVGGQMVNFYRGDYRFEASLHGFDGLGLNSALPQVGIYFPDDLANSKVEPLKADPYVLRAVLPDMEFLVPADGEDYEEAVKAAFPGQEDKVEALFFELRNLFGSMGSGESLQDMFDRLEIEDERIFAVVSALYIFLGTEPDRLPSVMFVGMWNGYHAMGPPGFYQFTGGSQALSNAMAEVIEENGGTIKLNTRATKVVVENGLATQVQTEDGGCYNADYVVSNANAYDLYLELIGEDVVAGLEGGADYLEELESLRSDIGATIFEVFLGVDHDFTEEFGEVHEIFAFSSSDLLDSFVGVETCDPELGIFGIANLTMVDPTNVAVPGKNAISVVGLGGWDCTEEWGFETSYEEYNQKKMEWAKVMLERAETVIPGLTEHVEVLEVATPRTVYGYTSNPHGTIFGWKSTTDRWALPMNTELLYSPIIDNLFLASAWANGGGQSVVIQSGMNAANEILKLQ